MAGDSDNAREKVLRWVASVPLTNEQIVGLSPVAFGAEVLMLTKLLRSSG